MEINSFKDSASEKGKLGAGWLKINLRYWYIYDIAKQ